MPSAVIETRVVFEGQPGLLETLISAMERHGATNIMTLFGQGHELLPGKGDRPMRPGKTVLLGAVREVNADFLHKALIDVFANEGVPSAAWITQYPATVTTLAIRPRRTSRVRTS
ncbi:hypothetical protein C4552_03615 [Candidatus Parcubacteria bacterium]|nr:MAG: hypothetical protein C4552_03615 [Candidatus Parcubacteria bacterium]